MKQLLLVVILVIACLPTFSSEPIVRVYETVPASSPNHTKAWRNIMTDAVSKGTANVVRGLHKPWAVNMPVDLQVGGIIFTMQSGYEALYDGTNNAAHPFYLETGKALAAVLDYSSSTPFVATNVSFSVLFKDQENAFSTNGIASQSFSPLFYAERWDSQGSVIEVLTNGQSVATQLVNRIVVFTGPYGFLTTAATLGQNIEYFRTHPLTNTFSFQVVWDGQAITAESKALTTTRSEMQVKNGTIALKAQRLPQFTYTVERTSDFTVWSIESSDACNAWNVGIPTTGNAFFRARENVVSSAAKSNSSKWKPSFGN